MVKAIRESMHSLAILQRNPDRATAAADRARLAFDLALAADFADDARNDDEADAYGALLDTLPTTVEGLAAMVGVLAHEQQALLSDDDEPELVSPFRTDADAFLFVQTLDEALTRMLARQQKPAPQFDGRLSLMFRDPLVRDAFARAERDNGEPAPAVIVPEPRRTDGAAVCVLELA